MIRLRQVVMLATGLLLSATVAVADSVVATLYGHELSATELEKMVSQRVVAEDLFGSSTRSEAQMETQAILSWADEILKQEMKERAAVQEDEVQRAIEDWRERGLIPPFTPAMQRFNQLALDAIAVFDAGGELTSEQLAELKDAWREVGNYNGLSREAADEYWDRQLALWRAGQGCVPCHPSTMEEYDALNREVVVMNLSRRKIGREAAEYYGLLDSDKLLREAAEIVEENGFSIPPEEALEVLLSWRESERWQVLKLQGGLSVPDKATANLVYRHLREREESLSLPLATHAAALHMHLMTIGDDGQVALMGR